MHLLPQFATRNQNIEPLLNTVHHCDAMVLLARLPDASVDMVFTSPPYNLRNSSGNGMKSPHKSKLWKPELANGYKDYSDNLPHEEYVQWQRDCLVEMFRVIKEDGVIFYNHKWRVQGGLLQDRQDIVNGFPVRQIIIWQRAGGINFNSGYFLPTYEVLYMIAKPKFKLLPEFVHLGDVWYIPQENNNSHPAPFPIGLPLRAIGSTDKTIILDPFMGSGTTALASKLLNRHYIGCDITQEYVDIANRRLRETDPYVATELSNGQKQLSLFEEQTA